MSKKDPQSPTSEAPARDAEPPPAPASSAHGSESFAQGSASSEGFALFALKAAGASARVARIKRRLALGVVLAFGAGLGLNVACGSGASGEASVNHSPAAAESQPRTATGETIAASDSTEGRDYSSFTHTNAEHARLPCLLCHRRPDNSPRPTLPGHQPCAGCHAPQFAGVGAGTRLTNEPPAGTQTAGAQPTSVQTNSTGQSICAICHTKDESAEVKQFPPLRSFTAEFDHARHATGAARPRAGCAACHQPARGRAALSIPAGLGAHANCYQCHSPRSRAGERDISSCDTCHSPGNHRPTPQTARAFRVGFSHSAHSRGLACADCHTLRSGAPQGRQVTSPQPLMHHASPRAQSCMSCHNNRRTFGGEDFDDCRRCHKGASWGN